MNLTNSSAFFLVPFFLRTFPRLLSGLVFHFHFIKVRKIFQRRSAKLCFVGLVLFGRSSAVCEAKVEKRIIVRNFYEHEALSACRRVFFICFPIIKAQRAFFSLPLHPLLGLFKKLLLRFFVL